MKKLGGFYGLNKIFSFFLKKTSTHTQKSLIEKNKNKLITTAYHRHKFRVVFVWCSTYKIFWPRKRCSIRLSLPLSLTASFRFGIYNTLDGLYSLYSSPVCLHLRLINQRRAKTHQYSGLSLHFSLYISFSFKWQNSGRGREREREKGKNKEVIFFKKISLSSGARGGKQIFRGV